MQVDDAIRYLGNFSRYQTLVFVLVTIASSVFPAWQMMATVFIGDAPAGYRCLTAGAGTGAGRSNGSSYTYLDQDGGNRTAGDQCFVDDPTTDLKTPCTEWDYVRGYGERTAVTDFDLICSRGFMATTAKSMFFGGVTAGSLTSGALSDMFGRKTVLVFALLAEGVLGTCLAFTSSYAAFVSIWFFVGVFEQGINVIGFVLAIEMFSPEKRTIAGCINGTAWGVGVVLLTPFAYLLRDWKHMQLAISIPNIVAAAIIAGLAFESVRWLVAKNRLESAEQVLHRIARMNGQDAPERFLTDEVTDAHDAAATPTAPPEKSALWAENNEIGAQQGAELKMAATEERPTATERPLSTARKMRLSDIRAAPKTFRNGAIMAYSWFVSSTVYYGMSLNSSTLAGDKYLNFFLLGLVEVPGYIIMYFVIDRWGRRPSLSLAHFIAGVSSIACACLSEASGVAAGPAILGFAMIGKFGSTMSFGIDFIYGAEIFPTPIRNIGIGTLSLSARIGGICAPLVLYLAELSPYIPMNVFGVVTLLAGALVLFLPETRREALTETLAENEAVARSARPPQLPWPACLPWPANDARRSRGGQRYQPADTKA